MVWLKSFLIVLAGIASLMVVGSIIVAYPIVGLVLITAAALAGITIIVRLIAFP